MQFHFVGHSKIFICLLWFKISWQHWKSSNTILVNNWRWFPQAAKLNIDASANHAWGKKQIDYMLGTPLHSFVVGYGNNAPQRPHHAAA